MAEIGADVALTIVACIINRKARRPDLFSCVEHFAPQPIHFQALGMILAGLLTPGPQPEVSPQTGRQ
jgi:hypothetical protein